MTSTVNNNNSDVRVLARFRPLNRLEIETTTSSSTSERPVSSSAPSSTNSSTCVHFDGSNKAAVGLRLTGEQCGHNFTFDYVFRPQDTQRSVFEEVGLPMLNNLFAGYNSTVLVYGQTGAGKTYTMMGPDGGSGGVDVASESCGLVPRVVAELFTRIEASRNASGDAAAMQYQIGVSFVEIYMEKIRDLLDTSRANLQIHEDKSGQGVYLADATVVYASCTDDVMTVLRDGSKNRAVASTRMNEQSSRSHSILCMTLVQKNETTLEQVMSKLFLVDLAGSEKVGKTRVEGKQLEEAKLINKSLTTLGIVINTLTEDATAHVPYRDSKLTRLLQDSLGGNSRTSLVCCCSPSSYNDAETLSTLRFGQRAKTIKNCARVNRVYTVDEMKILIREKQLQLDALNSGDDAVGVGDGGPVADTTTALDLAKLRAGRQELLDMHSDEKKSLEAQIEECVASTPRVVAVLRAMQQHDRFLTAEVRACHEAIADMRREDRALDDIDVLRQRDAALVMSIQLGYDRGEQHGAFLSNIKESVLSLMSDLQAAHCGVDATAVLDAPQKELGTLATLATSNNDMRSVGLDALSGSFQPPLSALSSLRPIGETLPSVRAEVELLERVLSPDEGSKTATAQELEEARLRYFSRMPDAMTSQAQRILRKHDDLVRQSMADYRRVRAGAMSAVSAGYCQQRRELVGQQLSDAESTLQSVRREGQKMRLEMSMMELKLSLRNDRIKNTNASILDERKHCEERKEHYARMIRAVQAERSMCVTESATLQRQCESYQSNMWGGHQTVGAVELGASSPTAQHHLHARSNITCPLRGGAHHN
eukprot:PhM_4_TR14544/c0_g1_i1/m.95658/K10396/KIF5; kinesin family member 5